jgi:hypothetical protein
MERFLEDRDESRIEKPSKIGRGLRTGPQRLEGLSRLPRPAPALHGEPADGDGED